MLSTSFGGQQATRRCRQTSYSRHARNFIQLQRRSRTVLQPCRAPELVKAVSAEGASSDGASSNSNSSSLSSNNSSPFFSRKKELKYLADHCNAPPYGISVISGPRNTGKTALLRECMRRRDSLNSSCLINARVTSITTPSQLALELLNTAVFRLAQQLFPDAESFHDLVTALDNAVYETQGRHAVADDSEVTFSGRVFAPFLEYLAADTQEAPPLAVVTEAYIELLDACYKAKAAGQLQEDGPPVLLLDQADALMEWDDQYKAEMKTLLGFFIAISTQQQRSHVILATSDHSFLTWLTQEIGPMFVQSYVIGDFPAQDARLLLDKCLQQLGNAGVADADWEWLQKLGEPGVADADWEAVHQVCGGNAGSLVLAAGAYTRLGDWTAALSQVNRDVWRSMKPGYRPGPGAGYTAADYATAVSAILNSPYKAVTDNDLSAVLGQQPLDAMVQANLLALRPYSHWAADIDAAAFGPDQRFAVVTAPTPVHLYLMEEQRSMLLAPLGLEKQEVPPIRSTEHSTGPSMSPIPTPDAVRAVTKELLEVQCDIAKLLCRIMDVDQQAREASKQAAYFKATDSQGSQLEYWQRKQQQLEEEAQLWRDKELQLRNTKLMLMKQEKQMTAPTPEGAAGSEGST